MERRHREALRMNHVRLIQEMIPGDVIDALYAKRILTQSMKEDIEAIPVARRRNSELLSLLPRRGEAAFEAFLEALRDTEQRHLAQLLATDSAGGAGAGGAGAGVAAGVVEEERGGGARDDEDSDCVGKAVQETNPRCRSPLDRRTRVEGHCPTLPPPSAPCTSEPGHVTSSCPTGSPPPRLRDTTDGSTGNSVRPCSPEFLRAHRASAYRMEATPRGLALLMSNVTFPGSAELDERAGGEIDVRRLGELLAQLGFQVEVEHDLTAQDMERSLRAFSARSEHRGADATVVALLSHGVDGALYGTDGALLKVEEIFSMFDNANAPHLQNKPKIFLVQACRGEDPDRGVDQSDGGSDARPVSPGNEQSDAARQAQARVRLPTSSDMIYGFACLKGTAALRNTRKGAWYIQALVEVVREQARDTHFADMLVKINSLIKEREAYAPGSEFHRCKEMSEYSSTLCRDLYLYPGLPGNRNHASAP